MNSRHPLVALALVAVSTIVGCASTAPPFDQMAASQVTAYRLQNYEVPAATTAAVPGAAATGLIPGLPPEITNWVQQGAGGLGGLMQGLQLPGLSLPGMPAATAAAPVPDNAPRFHGFRILGQTTVGDEGTRKDLGKLLGDSSSFDDKGANCLYAEMGISFSTGPTPTPYDVLLSFSCHNVAAYNFNWPHPNRGITPQTNEKLAVIVQKIFQY